VARKGDGTAVAWGHSGWGGDASSVDLTGVVDAMCGRRACVARKSDGTVVTWGHLAYGGDASSVDLTDVAGVGGGDTPATATGDPHLQNMLGQRFDLMRPGTSVLVRVPRGTPIEDALLVVKADARRLGAQCSDMYFQEINVTGTWADKAQPGGFHFDARGARHEKPQWVHLGPVELKVGHGHTDKGILYLNVFVKNLGRAGVPVGGLLGEDDHTEAAAPADGCQKLFSLNSGPHGLAAHRQGSIAVGS